MALLIIFNIITLPFAHSAVSHLTSPSIQQAIFDTAKQYHLDPKLVFAIIKVESNFNKKALSPRGAENLMQVIPQTSDYLGIENNRSILSHLNGACAYLRELINRFMTEAESSLDFVLAAYNAGPAAVEKYKGVPPFPETKEYILKVRAFYDKLRSGKNK